MWKVSEERASETLMEVTEGAETKQAKSVMPHAEEEQVHSSGAMGEQIPSEELQEREEGAHSQEQPLLVEEKEEAVAVV